MPIILLILYTYNFINNKLKLMRNYCRDSLLASLLDGVRAAGNKDVHVTMMPTVIGYRLGPLHLPVEEEIESLHLKLLLNPMSKSFSQCLRRFNANIPYSGLLHSVTQEVCDNW